MKKQFLSNQVAKSGARSLSVDYGKNPYEFVSAKRISSWLMKCFDKLPDDEGFKRTHRNLYVMINIWVALLDHYSINYRTVMAWIDEVGLTSFIADCQDFRLYTISNGARGRFIDYLSPLQGIPFKDRVFLLGFPKRTLFDVLDERELWIEFKKTNKEMRDRTYSPYLGSELSRVMDDLLAGYSRDLNAFILPPGATYEGAHTYLEKFDIAIRESKWLRDHGVNLPWFPLRETEEKPSNESRWLTVPKNFKTRRGIAPEPVSKQILGYQVDKAVRKLLLRNFIDLSDQERNQFAARIGSVVSNEGLDRVIADPLAKKYPEMVKEAKRGTRVATIDMSAASDSIRTILVSDTVNGKLYEDILLVRSTYVRYGKESIRSARWSTMGSVTTFWLETAIFTAIRLLAYDYYNLFADEKVFSSMLDCTYGDDCTIDVRVAPTFIDLLETFGFHVNEEKSFYEGSYRESCGKEYIDGEDITSLYYPRGTSQYELPQLVGLQHKLYHYPVANGFIRECIGQLAPSITTSEPGSMHDDLWSFAYHRTPVKNSVYCVRNPIWVLKIAYPEQQTNSLSLKNKDSSGELDDVNKVHVPSITIAKGSKELILKTKTKWEDFARKHHTTLSVERVEDSITYSQRDGEKVDFCLHSVFRTAYKPVPKDKVDECELLMLLLTLGGGVEHVNNSPFTDIRDMIRDRRSLVEKGKFQIAVTRSFD